MNEEICVRLQSRHHKNECNWLGFPNDGQRGFDDGFGSPFGWDDREEAVEAIEDMFDEYGREWCLKRWKITIETHRVSRELVDSEVVE